MSAELERAAAEKAAVASLRGSTKAIETVLARNVVLEDALRTAGSNLRDAKRYVGDGAYIWRSSSDSGSSKKATDLLEEQAQAALKLVS